MAGRRLIIGDVHGHYRSLYRLLELAEPDAEDQVYCLGDLIDRGPDSAKVIALVRSQGYVSLMGNHEHLLSQVLAFPELIELRLHWFQAGGQATLSSFGSWEALAELQPWLQQLPLYLDLGEIWLVHAGVDPDLPLSRQNANEFCWIRDRFLMQTRPFFTNKTILVGHTITCTMNGIQPGYLAAGAGWLGLDTGVYHPSSGWLTALDWDNQRVFQVHAHGDATQIYDLSDRVQTVTPQQLATRRSLLRQPRA
ncbi:metallophosphoesterase [Synechococcus elongatus]|uniref:metallophosphoesterase n=1 Tax=Synechococcus elongatus TaxID=32046 RepID=UPI0030CDAC28